MRALLAACFTVAAAASQPAEFTEYEVKSAMLYNFARFVDWPPGAFPDSRKPIVIGIVGQDPFGSMLEDMVCDKAVSGRSIVVRRLHMFPPPETVHLLFISRSERARLKELLQAAARLPVLTVSDMDGFAGAGARSDS